MRPLTPSAMLLPVRTRRQRKPFPVSFALGADFFMQLRCCRVSEQEKKDLIERVEAALDKVRPALERDGGNVELVEIGEDAGAV